MVSWFYQQLPISTVELHGVTYPLYHIFHPSEHGTLRVLDELHITTVAVDPDHEGKGHGTRLCIELLRLGVATGATAATGDAYQGGRDYDTLSKWAKDNLGPTCGAENIDLCTDDQKAVIKEKQALSDADLDAEIAAAEGEIKQADTDLEELLKSLQAQYEAGKKKKDETIAEKSPALALLRSVKRAKTGGAKTEL